MFTTAKAQLRAENEELRARIVELEALLHEKESGSLSETSSQGLNEKPAGRQEEIDTEKQFRIMFDQAVIGIAKIDGQTKQIIRSNPAFKEMLGYSPDEPESLNVIDITHPDDMDESRAAMKRLQDGEVDSFLIEKRYLKKDGGILWGRTTVTRYHGQKEGTHYRIAFVENITQSKASEQALRASEERFELAVKGSNDGLWDWVDVDSELIWMSPRLYELLGYGSDDTLPTITFFRSLLHPDDEERFQQCIKAHIEDRDPYDIEYRLLVGGGDYKWFRARGQALWNEEGKAVRVSGSLTDISAQKNYEEELKRNSEALRRAKEKAEAGTRAKSEFLANMSHEIRTPMNGILGYAEILLDTALDDVQREHLNIVRNNGGRLLDLLDGILDISKIESGLMEIENRSFDVHALLDNVIKMIEPAALQKDLVLACEVEPNVPVRLRGDEKKLMQVLTNLLSNAVKFTDKGDISLLVGSQKIGSETHRLHLTVCDTGIGISMSHIDKIFEKFTQLDASPTRRHSGSGLGLTISQRLVEMMGGTMWVDSQEGIGSTFHVQLPFGAPLKHQDVHLEIDMDGLGGKVIVLAVDDAVVELQLSQQLKTFGLVVHPAHNAIEMEQIFDELDVVDLCLIDVVGDGAGGHSVAQHLNGITNSSIPLLLLTNENAPLNIDNMNLRILQKPSENELLFQSLLALLEFEKASPPQGGQIVANESYQGDGFASREEADIAEVPHSNDLKILLVEDEEDNQKLALYFLEKLGYQATLATNGLQALGALEGNDFDIILMDIQMPAMDGVETTRKIRNLNNLQTIPWIVAVTARAMVGDRENFIESGMDDYLSKPYTKEALVAVLERAKKEINRNKSETDLDLA